MPKEKFNIYEGIYFYDINRAELMKGEIAGLTLDAEDSSVIAYGVSSGNFMTYISDERLIARELNEETKVRMLEAIEEGNSILFEVQLSAIKALSDKRINNFNTAFEKAINKNK